MPCGVSFDADSMQFDNLSALTSKTNVTGYYGGLRLLRAACKKYARAYVPATGLVVLLGTQRRVPQPQRGRFRTGEVFFAVPLRSAAPQLLLIDRSIRRFGELAIANGLEAKTSERNFAMTCASLCSVCTMQHQI